MFLKNDQWFREKIAAPATNDDVRHGLLSVKDLYILATTYLETVERKYESDKNKDNDAEIESPELLAAKGIVKDSNLCLKDLLKKEVVSKGCVDFLKDTGKFADRIDDNPKVSHVLFVIRHYHSVLGVIAYRMMYAAENQYDRPGPEDDSTGTELATGQGKRT